jgi:hypothetical protein
MGAFGKLRKIWEKIKDVGRKVWGGFKKVLPAIKLAGSAVASGLGGPGAGLAVSKGFDVAEAVGDQIASGNVSRLFTGQSLSDRLTLKG